MLPLPHVICNVLQAIEVAQIMDQSLDENNFELVLRSIMIAESCISSSLEKLTDSTTPELMATLLSCFSASWVYSKVILLGISFLEREHRYGIMDLGSNVSFGKIPFFFFYLSYVY